MDPLFGETEPQKGRNGTLPWHKQQRRKIILIGGL